MEIENTAHRAVMTVRNMNRFVFSAWGFRGGEHGVKGTAVLNPGRPDERSIGKISVLELNRGDVIQITSPTGGGFGDPMERDLAAIASEIRNGMLSTERASQVYAVVFDEHGQIDEVATAARRRERTRADTPEFTFCDERLRQDQVWPQDMRRQLAAMALTYDQRIRSQLVGTVHHRMMNDGHQVDTKIIQQMVDDEAANMTGVRRLSV
jgi:N-methylhydantoinase B